MLLPSTTPPPLFSEAPGAHTNACSALRRRTSALLRRIRSPQQRHLRPSPRHLRCHTSADANQLQRLIELIRNGKVEEALEFAQEELAPRGEENQGFLEELERTVALLAFEDVTNCPVSELLDISQRLKTASEVNAAILTSQSHEKGDFRLASGKITSHSRLRMRVDNNIPLSATNSYEDEGEN
ncbi:hypothetical protein MIMGU_mgv1a018190mg [Erythranthe guttata]|uniref:CRA domain-containing protein n=1 Tax=Erythranthe guttata TaxID=4155 RepID=A0A022S3C9_ERYGU|nr:hypothetical protein MIMGU_mgv1a018190mg [Erythranthe guttata]